MMIYCNIAEILREKLHINSHNVLINSHISIAGKNSFPAEENVCLNLQKMKIVCMDNIHYTKICNYDSTI